MEDEGGLAKERLRKAVYDAIVTLSECVTETVLQKTLNSLDQSSWMEVVEERYLGHICGFPLCNNPVKVKNSQKYRIDLKNKKVFERSAEIDKFCCQTCFLRSVAIRTQLEAEPLWIRGNHRVKVFDLKAENIIKQQQNICDFEFIEDGELVTSFETLKIGDTVESDNEDDNEGTKTDEEKSVHDSDEFYDLCRPYPPVRPAVSSSEERTHMPIVKVANKIAMNANRDDKQFLESEKLARLRKKYQQNRSRRPPEIIKAKPLSLLFINKTPENFFEKFRITLSSEVKIVELDHFHFLREWCGPETICYLKFCRRVSLRDNEKEKSSEVGSIIAPFYAGGRSVNRETGRIIFLPPIDSIDQLKQRVSVLSELLKPSWRILEGILNVNGCEQQALNIIATFRLSAENAVLERKTCNLAVAIIFRLLAYYDASLMGFYADDDTMSSKLMIYLERIGCDAKCYFEILSTVMNKLE